MSVASSISRPNESSSQTADTLANSIVLLGVLMVGQRLIGFGRSFFVCHVLSPAEVGQWDLSFSFLTLAAPLAVFGIPGCFGRYIAQFQVRHESSWFLRRTAVTCGCLSVTGAGVLFLMRSQVAKVVYGDANCLDLMALLSIGLPAVVFFNFLTCWFSGLRLNRIVVRLQFAQTLLFAALCAFLLLTPTASAQSVIVAYLASCLLTCLLGCSYLIGAADQKCAVVARSVRDPMWTKIVSFALWIWLSNILINLFAICDRLLIVNYASASIAEGQSLVGQYHSSRILPLLLVSIGGMAGSMMTPYLSHDWETSRRDEAHAKMNLMLKAMAILCYVFSLSALFLAPAFFSGIWKDKFASGEAMLPLTLTYCTWASLTLVAQKYFWCIERTWLSSCALLVGLAINVALGLALLPIFGMHGVVVATLVAHLCVLATVYFLCVRWGLALDKCVIWLSMLPVLFCFGSVASIAGLAAIITLTFSGEYIFRDSEKSQFCSAFVKHRGNVQRFLMRMSPTSNTTIQPRP